MSNLHRALIKRRDELKKRRMDGRADPMTKAIRKAEAKRRLVSAGILDQEGNVIHHISR